MSEKATSVGFVPWHWLVRIGVLIALCIGFGRRVWEVREQLATYEPALQLEWLCLSGFCCAVGLTSFGCYWWRLLEEQGVRPGWRRALAAHFVGNLGRYAPGKALMLYLRADLLRSGRASIPKTIVTTVQESLLTMAVGAAAAFFLLGWYGLPNASYYSTGAALFAAVMGAASLPVAADWIVRWLGRWRPLEHLGGWRTTWSGWFSGIGFVSVGWLFLAGSLWAVLLSVDSQADQLSAGLMILAICLSTVGGFLSLAPAGLGAQEWILVETLSSVVGDERAIVGAVALRFVWLATDGVLWLLGWLLWRLRKTEAGRAPAD